MFLERCNDFNDLTSPIGRAAENSHRQGPEACPSRQARDFEAVTSLTFSTIRKAARSLEHCSWIGNYGVLVKCQQPLPVVLYYHVCLHLPFILVLHSIFRRYVAVALMNCINQDHVTGYKMNCHTI